MPAFRNLTGQKYNRLTAVEYVGQTRFKKAIWRFECECGTDDFTSIGADVTGGKTQSCGCLKREVLAEFARKNIKDIPGYFGLHHRITLAKGGANNYKCVDCDRQAKQWSYDKLDDSDYNAVVSLKGKAITVKYSLDLDHYQPRCTRCHLAYDSVF